MNRIYKLYSFLILFSVNFIGDYNIWNVPAIIFVLPAVLIPLGFRKNYLLSKKNLVFSLFLISFLIIDLFKSIIELTNWQLIIHYLSFAIIVHGLNNYNLSLSKNFTRILMLVLTAIFIYSRIDFIFGPNIWYRILFFLIIFSGLPPLYLVLVPLISKSRGAIISFLLYLGILKLNRRRILLSLLLLILGSTSIYLIFPKIADLNNSFSRLFLFSLENGSLNDRVKVFSFLNFKSLIFGLNQFEWNALTSFIKYPHNIFLELVFRYGIIGLIFFNYSLYHIVKQIRTMKIILLLVTPLLFSGSLLDNLGLLTFIYCYDFKYYNSKL